MKVHSIKTDNHDILNKIKLRKKATKGLKELYVLDLFAGENKLWSTFDKRRYYGVEKEKNKGKNLNADNLRVISSIDLSGFNVVDCDTYGIPANQIAMLYANPTLKKGTVIIFTSITNKMSALNKIIIEHFKLERIYKKAKTQINGKAQELFYAFLYDKGVKEVYIYQKKGQYVKNYGYFIV